MALRPAPRKKIVDYNELDRLQQDIFGTPRTAIETEPETTPNIPAEQSTVSGQTEKQDAKKKSAPKKSVEKPVVENSVANTLGRNLSDLDAIASSIAATKAGQGRHTTRPFSIPRTLIIDTTRLKSKFRSVDEQFTQNVIIDYLLREALAVVTAENYKDLKTAAFETVKRPDEITRRSLTVTEEVVYQMSELKAQINLETGKKYSNDEIFSTLLALAISWLYQNEVLSS